MSRLLRAAALLLFFFFPSLSEAATGTLAWAVTTQTTPPLFLDTVGSGTSNVGHRSALDAAGNLYVAATTLDASGSCMVFLKYSGTDGQIAWRHDICPGDTTTFASALVLDATGEVLVAGAQSGSGYVAKLSGATGNPVWTQFIAPISSTSSALAIGVASSGDARVVASDGGNLAVYGFAGADGSLQFRNALTNGLGSAKLTGFAVDSGGASVVSEFDSDGNNTTAGRITRIDNLGSILWQVAAADAPVTADASGNVIASSVAGIEKYDASTGALVWTQSAAQGAVATDSAGNIYVTGAANQDISTGASDVGTWKLAPDGSIVWAQVISDPSTHGAGAAIALDGAGGVLVAANLGNSDGTHSEQTIKLSAADGTIAWTATDHDATVANFAYAVHANSQGIVELGQAVQQAQSTQLGLRVLKYVDSSAPPPKSDATVTLASSTNPSNAGESVTFSVAVSGTTGSPTGIVDFLDGSSAIADCTGVALSGGSAACVTSALTQGTHSVSASYSGDSAFNPATSNIVTQTVQPPPPPPPSQFTLTVATAGSGAGSVSSSPAGIDCGATCSATFSAGTAVTLVPTAASGSTFTGWSGGGCSGTSACTVTMNAATSVTATFETANTANPIRLGNISTRGDVLTGEDVLIGGFIIGGTGNKTVAIVATGPSLAAYGITNPLMNPMIQLVRQSDRTVIATNDDWQSDANAAQLQASGFAPPDPREAGLYVNLAPGAYTVVVSGVGDTTGVALIGVYEVDHPEVPLVNISTRGLVQTGGNVMIGGFIVNGTAPQTLAITATGPSLAAFGIANPLANPTLTIVRQSDHTIVATNDDWQSDPNAAQLQAKGFAPSDPREAGLLVTLPPGAYTAIVGGVGNTTGVSLIGVYAAQ